MNIKNILEAMIKSVDGKLQHLEFDRPTPKDMEEIADQIRTPKQKERFKKTREVDFAFGVAGLARFRANFYVQRGSIAMVFRHVPVEILTLDDLGLPGILKELALMQRGLIFVTGTVGSGKSTSRSVKSRTFSATEVASSPPGPLPMTTTWVSSRRLPITISGLPSCLEQQQVRIAQLPY